MKLTFFLTLFMVIQGYATTYSQNTKLTVHLESRPLNKLIKEIEQQSEFKFFYINNEVDVTQKVSVNASLMQVEDVLDLALAEIPYDYEVMENNVIVIKPKEVVTETTSQQKRGVVSGVVTDRDGVTMPGVTVVIVGTGKGVVTDIDGKYSINYGPEVKMLRFSFVGMKTEDVPVKEAGTINLEMNFDAIGLEDVVVVGFGSTKKVNLTGAVSTVKSEVIENRAVANASQALQGVVPGLTITTNTSGGEPGSTMDMNIRGFTTLSGDGSPYILIDGVEQDINSINPEDIEDVTILKDAASSSIYGSRAAYGVILITTKEGKKGVKVSYSNNFTFSTTTNLPEMASSLDFANYFNLASRNDGNGDVFAPEIMELIEQYIADPVNTPGTTPDSNTPTRWGSYMKANANTDWFDTLYKDWSSRQSHTVSVNGAGDNVKYYMSGGYFDQEGQLEYGDDGYKRYNFKVKLDSEINKWLKLFSNTSYNRTEIDRPSYSKGLFYHNIARRWPSNPITDPNGHFVESSEIPFLIDGGRYLNNQDYLVISAGVELEPIKDWVTKFTYNWKVGSYASTIHEALVDHYGVDEQPLAMRSINSYQTHSTHGTYSSPTLFSTYTKSLNDTHNFKIMGGFQQEESKSEYKTVKKTNLVTDEVPSISTATGILTAYDGKEHWSTRSFFGRFNYNYKEKYLLEVNWRMDGSSRFEEGSRWGSFPSVSAAYNVAKEEFWSIDNIVNLCKVRASYGSLGNHNVPNYQYIERIPVNTQHSWIMGDERPIYTQAPSLVSDNLTWETVSMVTVGLDLAMFTNRLSVSADWYRRITSDMFGPADTTPATLGTSAPQANNAELQTTGWEFSTKWNDRVGAVKYNAALNLSGYRGEVTKYNNRTKLRSSYYEGQDLGEIWGYKTDGLFQSDDEVAAWHDQSKISGNVWQSGDVKYVDLDGSGVIDWGENTADDAGDKIVIGNSTPDLQYSFSAGVNWKGFDFNMFWQGVAGKDVWIGGNFLFGASGGTWQSTVFKDHLDYWSPENPDAYYARPYLSNGGKNQQVSDRYLQNGSYLRLKSIQLGYTIPEEITEAISMKKGRIFVTGENLLTFSKMSDVFDPEAINGPWGAGKIYPLSLVISTGINITF